ncbi:SDR family oxidoreductase [Brucepastera parasyntrophica]|uniref:SDR family oxidoreductase n=1 Tax=Brucepastera parasyntrophica TaxID=2880008 RepID=UPI00210EC32D|nr:SDR family oxidoreductase [Brucepastera parasyntrophica]ULQ59950.1 SDR family oxidoreductase [Brucepastera parasyntrophica]
MKDIRGKVILITGGASGIGRLVGLMLAERGGKIVVWDLNAEAIEKLESEGKEKGFSIRGMVCDVSNREEVYLQAKKVTEETGPVDILVNNAGIVSGTTFLNIPDEKILKTMDVNLFPVFWTLKAFLPSMIERNTGHIVTISSAAGIIGVTGLSDYSASKFAAFGFHESIRMELRGLGKKIGTTIVCPFFINTGMFKGVKTRVPFMFPILESEYVAKKLPGLSSKTKEAYSAVDSFPGLFTAVSPGRRI